MHLREFSLIVFCCSIVCLTATKTDEFYEELYVKPLQSGLVSFDFRFTTKWNVSVHDEEICKSYLISDAGLDLIDRSTFN